LTKSFDIDYGDSIEWQNKELLQPVSLKDKYFKLIISKEKESFFASVTGIKIFEKKDRQADSNNKFGMPTLGFR
jgi:hypothetical protein